MHIKIQAPQNEWGIKEVKVELAYSASRKRYYATDPRQRVNVYWNPITGWYLNQLFGTSRTEKLPGVPEAIAKLNANVQSGKPVDVSDLFDSYDDEGNLVSHSLEEGE